MIDKIKFYLFISSMIGSLLLGIKILFGEFDLRFLLAGFLFGYPLSFIFLVFLKKRGIKIDEPD